jgi:hypothetical protein
VQFVFIGKLSKAQNGAMDDTAAKRSLIDEELKKLLHANQRVMAAEASAINLSALQNLPALQESQADP